MKGIEPSPKAWEAFVLPLNYTRLMLHVISTKSWLTLRADYGWGDRSCKVGSDGAETIGAGRWYCSPTSSTCGDISDDAVARDEDAMPDRMPQSDSL